MWSEQFKDKEGKTKYRYYEKYRDPYTNKWKRVSIVLNKNTKASQKEAVFQLDDKIKTKMSSTNNNSLKTLTIHELINEWFQHYKNTSGSKVTTLKNMKVRLKNIKINIDASTLVSKLDYKYAQNLITTLSETYSDNQVRRQLNDLKKAVAYATKFYGYTNKHILNDVEVPKKAKTLEDIEKEEQKVYNYLEMKQVLKIRNFILTKNIQIRD